MHHEHDDGEDIFPTCQHCGLPFRVESQHERNLFSQHVYEKHRHAFLVLFAAYDRCSKEAQIAMDSVLARCKFIV